MQSPCNHELHQVTHAHSIYHAKDPSLGKRCKSHKARSRKSLHRASQADHGPPPCSGSKGRVTSRDKLVAALGQAVSKGLGVLDDLLLVGLEVRANCLLQCTCQTCDGVVMWATLQAHPWSDHTPLISCCRTGPTFEYTYLKATLLRAHQQI